MRREPIIKSSSAERLLDLWADLLEVKIVMEVLDILVV